MTKTVSATEAKNTFGAILKHLETTDEDVVIESRGVPTAVVVSIERFREIEELEERAKRQRALEEFRKLRAEIARQNEDMSTAEAQDFAEQLSDEIMENVVAKHPVKAAH
jgi:prevent-host-death family protein